MKLILLSALLAITGCGCAGLPLAEVKPETARIEVGDGVCSATYIGPQTILTARHCLATDAGVLTIDGERAGFALLAQDDNDHVMLRVTVKRSHWAVQGRRPLQGDEVFKHGNPLGLKNVLIVGRVAGWLDNGAMLIDGTGWKGDSGAAVWDRNGRIVGVVSAIGGAQAFYLLIAFPLEFSEADWKAART